MATIADIDDIARPLIDLYHGHKKVGICLIGSIILKELLKTHDYLAQLIQGYLCFDDYYCSHYWLDINGIRYDISAKLFERYNKVLTAKPVIKRPKHLLHTDLDIYAADMEDIYNQYQFIGLTAIISKIQPFVREFIQATIKPSFFYIIKKLIKHMHYNAFRIRIID